MLGEQLTFGKSVLGVKQGEIPATKWFRATGTYLIVHSASILAPFYPLRPGRFTEAEPR